MYINQLGVFVQSVFAPKCTNKVGACKPQPQQTLHTKIEVQSFRWLTLGVYQLAATKIIPLHRFYQLTIRGKKSYIRLRKTIYWIRFLRINVQLIFFFNLLQYGSTSREHAQHLVVPSRGVCRLCNHKASCKQPSTIYPDLWWSMAVNDYEWMMNDK